MTHIPPYSDNEVGEIDIDKDPATILDIDAIAISCIASVDVKQPPLLKTINIGTTDTHTLYTFQSSGCHTNIVLKT